jgi:TPR repeat protein
MKRMALAALLLAALIVPARADFQAGVKAYNQGDHATALKEWKPLAEGGHGDAQNNLGIMYDQGEAVAEDPATAVRWYRAAARRGLSDAQNNLGRMYELGRGVDQDMIQAHKWYNIAVATGNDAARRNTERVTKRLSAEELGQAREMARAWLVANQPE